MSAQSIKKAKRPRAATTLERKLKIIKNVEADLHCFKEVLTKIKVRIRPTLDSFFKKADNSQSSASAF
jgi:uncharacterized protein YdeI (BOF family)